MSIKVIWDNEEKTILRYAFEGAWKWTDFQVATKDAAALLDAVDHPVGVIIDLQSSNTVPDQPLANIKHAFANPRHHNVGLTVVVGANAFFSALASSAQRIYRSVSGNYDYRLVKTLDEARRILTKDTQLAQAYSNAKHE